MTDLNMMMREQARNGLQAQLDAAVTNGDMEAARKVTDQMTALAVATAPKAPPFGQEDIRAELDKQDWFGIDPRRSAKAVELGKTMDPRKFTSAAAFAEALVKAVNEEFKPAATGASDDADEDDDADEGEGDTDGTGKEVAAKKPRRSDGPGEGDTNVRAAARRSSGPWAKLTDAPADVQKEIKRQTEKFVSSHASEKQRESFVTKALESHYAAHQRTKGKK